MRFNGVDICSVHRAISVAKEIPPGMPERSVETVSGREGETLAGTVVKRGEYTVRVNIAGKSRAEAWRVRALLAAWAGSSGETTAELEPTHWPGMAYEAIVGGISPPEFTFGFAVVEITFVLPRPFAHEKMTSRANGNGTVAMMIGGSSACRPEITQTIGAARNGVAWTLDGNVFFTLKGSFSAGQILKVNFNDGSVLLGTAHIESRMNVQATKWHPGFLPGYHTISSSDGGALDVRWRNEWM